MVSGCSFLKQNTVRERKKTEKLRESFTDVAASCVTYVECDVLKSFVYSTERVAIGELNS